MKALKWQLDKQGLDKRLEDFGVNNETKFMITGGIMVGFWGATISLKSTESEEEIKVPYTQVEVDVTPEQYDINQQKHPMSLQSDMLKELAKEVKEYVSDNYNIIIVDWVNN